MNNELFICQDFSIEFCDFEAKFSWNFVGISAKFSENLKFCRESSKIPEKKQYFSGNLQKKIGKLWNYSIFRLNNSFASLLVPEAAGYAETAAEQPERNQVQRVQEAHMVQRVDVSPRKETIDSPGEGNHA